MTKRNRRTFSSEFQLESAQLVVEQRYSVSEAAKAMNVSKSTMVRGLANSKKNNKAFHKYLSDDVRTNRAP